MTNFARAIETRYNGRRYRSRTEARWAVFFTTLGIAFEHEREGYHLPAGSYLPDLWLTKDGQAPTWVEVKGDNPDRRAKILLAQLACFTHTDAALVRGMPLEHPVYFMTAQAGCAARWQGTHEQPARAWLLALAKRYGANDDLQAAANAATSARFDHGENG